MTRFKKSLVWLILVLLFAFGGTALWFKMKVAEQPTEHKEPDLIVPTFEVPDPSDVE